MLSLDDVMSQPRREVEFTLECSGNTGLPFFIGGIGNAVWGGAALAPLLRRCSAARVRDRGRLLGHRLGHGHDPRQQRDLSVPGTPATRRAGCQTEGLDITITEQFARSMSLADAMAPDNLLCYEMNGEPLPPEHGAPVRLIAPGWYGVANVKWLSRIEVIDHRFAGRFMARDYVTFREHTEARDHGVDVRDRRPARLKSAPAKVVRNDGRYRVIGVAWGGKIGRVDVAIDGGAWQPADLVDGRRSRTLDRVGMAILDLRLGHPLAGGAHCRVPGDTTRTASRNRARRSDHRRQADVLGEQRADHPLGPHLLNPGMR